jgi:hypothetical protein
MKSYPEQFDEFERITETMLEIHKRKAADYGANAIGTTGFYGIVVRMSDKVQRLLTLSGKHTDGNKAQVWSETVEDTLLDLASYAIIGVIYLRNKWGK